MPEPWIPPPVWLGENILWDQDLSLYEAADLMLYLISNERTAITQYVLPGLKIQDATISGSDGDDEEEEPEEESKGGDKGGGEAGGLGIPEDEIVETVLDSTRKARNRRGALKGLALELLAATVLRHLDRCRQALTWVKTRDGQPNGQAGKGLADAIAIFPRTKKSREFRIVAEVSAKASMSRGDFRDQVRGALKHARAESDKHPGVPIYALIVNNAKFAEDPAFKDEFQSEYRRMLDKDELAPNDMVRLVPMNSGDFGMVAARLFLDLPAEDRYFSPEVLSNALDMLHRAVLQPVYLEAKTWMVEMFLKAVHAGIERAKKAAPKPKRRRTSRP